MKGRAGTSPEWDGAVTARRATPSPEYLRLATLPSRSLEKIIVRGETPDAAALAGYEFLGTNTPFTASLLRIRKFLKGFYRSPSNGAVFGYNTPVRQGTPQAPWIARPSEAAPKRFGFYAVVPVDATSRDNAYLHATLLDYGRGPNPRLSVVRTLRDYLVRVDPGSDDLLLGKAYMAFGPVRVPVSYFVLQRSGPTSFTGPNSR
jgi:hypothetical protein